MKGREPHVREGGADAPVGGGSWRRWPGALGTYTGAGIRVRESNDTLGFENGLEVRCSICTAHLPEHRGLETYTTRTWLRAAHRPPPTVRLPVARTFGRFLSCPRLDLEVWPSRRAALDLHAPLAHRVDTFLAGPRHHVSPLY